MSEEVAIEAEVAPAPELDVTVTPEPSAAVPPPDLVDPFVVNAQKP
jgi:hypothetical protein